MPFYTILQLPRSLPQQRLFRGLRKRKMGIRRRKQMASAPASNPSPSSLPEYTLPNTGKNKLYYRKD